jgi:hypothetical protein
MLIGHAVLTPRMCTRNPLPDWALVARVPTPPPFIPPSADADVDMTENVEADLSSQSGESQFRSFMFTI